MKQRNTICVYDLSLQTKQRNPLKKKHKFQQQKKKGKKEFVFNSRPKQKERTLTNILFQGVSSSTNPHLEISKSSTGNNPLSNTLKSLITFTHG